MVADTTGIPERCSGSIKEDWVLIHYFLKGWAWNHVRTNVTVYAFDLKDFHVEFNDFPLLEQSYIDTIVGSILSKRKRITDAIRASPTQVKFDKICTPKFKKEFPKLNINDLVSTPPIQSEPLPVFKKKLQWNGCWYKPWTWLKIKIILVHTFDFKDMK